MQTFLPFSDFRLSAQSLCRKRRFKQVLESSQILNTLEGRSEGWKNHPAVRMWEGYEEALKLYYCEFYDYCKDIDKVNFKKLQPMLRPENPNLPEWLGDKHFHYSHQCNLARKAQNDPKLKSAMESVGLQLELLDINTPYMWPTKEQTDA